MGGGGGAGEISDQFNRLKLNLPKLTLYPFKKPLWVNFITTNVTSKLKKECLSEFVLKRMDMKNEKMRQFFYLLRKTEDFLPAACRNFQPWGRLVTD